MTKILTGILTTIIVVIATIFGIAYFKPNSNTLYVSNLTNSNVIIKSISVNRRELGQGDRALGIKGSGPSVGYQFRARSGAVLTLKAKLGEGEEIQLTCKLEDANNVGCKYLSGIRDGPSLSCFCDSYADFYD